MQSMNVRFLKVMLAEMLHGVLQMWSTDSRVHHSLIQVTGALQKRDLHVREGFGMERLETLHRCMNMMEGYHALYSLRTDLRGHCVVFI